MPLADADRLLSEFLAEEAPPHEPPILLPAVLARTALTRRRPAWRIPSWWLPARLAWRPRSPGRPTTMFTFATVGAILTLAGGLLFTLLSLAGQSPPPPLVPLPAEAQLEAGTRYLVDREDAFGGGSISFTVPAEGWFTIDTWFLGKDVVDPGVSFYDVTLLPYGSRITNLHADPCHWTGSELEPAVGPTVDDLANAFMSQPAQNALSVSDVTIDGYSGKKVELAIPDDVDTSQCDQGNYGRWYTDGDPFGYAPYMYDSAQHDTVYILDVEGSRWVIDTNFVPGTTAETLAELEQLVASIQIEPPAPAGGSSSPSPGVASASLSSVGWAWPAPLRPEPSGDAVVSELPTDTTTGLTDPVGDTETPLYPFADIEGVGDDGTSVWIDVAGAAPRPLPDPGELWIAYGLVLDTDGDGVPDERLGIDNNSPTDSHREWRTDLHTGQTVDPGDASGTFDTRFPGELAGDEARARFNVSGYPARFYVWAYLIQGGQVIAADYAPDAGWLEPER
jgi:hypothetical protein